MIRLKKNQHSTVQSYGQFYLVYVYFACISNHKFGYIFRQYHGEFGILQVDSRDSLVAQMVKHLPAMQETWVRSLGQEDPLEKEMATHSSTLA